MFTQRRNRRFNYKSRFKEKSEETKREAFKESWEAAKMSNTKRGKFGSSLIWFAIALALVLFLMYYLETKAA